MERSNYGSIILARFHGSWTWTDWHFVLVSSIYFFLVLVTRAIDSADHTLSFTLHVNLLYQVSYRIRGHDVAVQ